MKNTLSVSLLICLFFLFSCSNQAQVDQLQQEINTYNQKISEYETQISVYQEKITELETKLQAFDEFEIDSVGLLNIQDEIERLRGDNLALRQANDSLEGVIYEFENPGMEAPDPHPTIPVEPIK
jgi:septal ring factor EnvC (AmiA/AmiB activator)